MTATPEPVAAAILHRALDGAGGTIDFADDEELQSIRAEAASLGFAVLDVNTEGGRNGFALGPLWCALVAVEPVDDIPPIASVGASERLIRWMRNELDGRLSALAAQSPLVMAVHNADLLEPFTAQELGSLRDLAHEWPIVLVLPAPSSSTVAAPPAVRSLEVHDSFILQLLAASDVALTCDDVAELAGGSVDGAMGAALATLVDAGAVVECRGHFAIATEAQRTRSLNELPASVRRGLRRGVFDVLRRRGVGPVAVSEMALDSALPEERAAIDVLTVAMNQLRQNDPETAAQCGLGAAELLRGPSELLTALAWQLLPLLWQVGRADDARDLARRVFSERGVPDAEAQTLLWMARFEGSTDRALAHTTTALSTPGVSAPVRARILGTHLRLISTLGRTDEIDRLLPGALIEAEASAEWEALSRLQTCDAIRTFYAGDYVGSLERTQLADATWRRSGADNAERMPEMIWGPHLRSQLQDPSQALAELDELLTALHDRGQAFATRFVHSERSLVLLTLGRLADASDEAVLATTASEQQWSLAAGARDRLQAIALSVRLKVALHVGDAAELSDIRSILTDAAPPLGSEAAARIAWWMFLLDDAQGTTAEGARSVNPDTLSIVSWLDPSDEVLICRALLINGYRDAALALVERAARRARRPSSHPLARTLSDHLSGLYLWRSDLLDGAVRGWEKLRRPLAAAAARSDLGVRRDEAGEPRGIELVHEAHDELLALGAQRDAWRIRWWLRARGRAVKGPRSVAESLLTPAETRVADRAALGVTVGRIATELSLSPHTVITHLRHIYTKLGINSRVELIQWASRSALSR